MASSKYRAKRGAPATHWPPRKLKGYTAWARRRRRGERIILHAEDCPLGDACDCVPVTLEHGALA